MASSAKLRFDALKMKGLNDRDAMWAVIDHFNELHWHDRDRYGQEIKALKAEITELKKRLDAQSG